MQLDLPDILARIPPAPSPGWLLNLDSATDADRAASGLNYLAACQHPHCAFLRYQVGAPYTQQPGTIGLYAHAQTEL